MGFAKLMKRPSAFIPVAMSLAALALVITHVSLYGVVRGGDEGTAARIFQLLLVSEVPIVLYFTATWLPRSPRDALKVLALQAGAMVAALAPVILLEM